MIVYNISIKIDTAIETEWVEWQKKEHIPDVMASGQFTDYTFYRLLEQEESEGCTYIVQYFATDMDHYNRYINLYASSLREKAFSKWENKFIAFRSIMQVVN